MITLKAYYSDVEMDEMAGNFVDFKQCNDIYDSDIDCVDEAGRTIAIFRKKVFSMQVTIPAFHNLIGAAASSLNRGIAAGLDTQISNTRQMRVGKKARLRQIKEDGSLSKTSYAPSVNSGIAGYYDKSVRFPVCRTTAWTQSHMNKFRGAMPIVERATQLFEQLAPVQYAAQKKFYDQIPKDFRIPNTVYTTITVNKNFRTALHKDAGDYDSGLGNLIVLQKGDFNGYYFCIPRYKIGFNVKHGDFLLANVHEWHGNSELLCSDKDYTRLSLVLYARKNMDKCGTKEEELRQGVITSERRYFS